MDKATEQGTMGKEAFWARLQTNLNRIAIEEIARIRAYADDDVDKAILAARRAATRAGKAAKAARRAATRAAHKAYNAERKAADMAFVIARMADMANR